MEFDVPPSLPNGASVAADPLNQYPVIGGSVSFESDGTGEDWAVYRLGPNSTTLATAHWVQGAYRVTTAVPSEDNTMRVTGFGVDHMPSGTGAHHCRGGSNHGNAAELRRIVPAVGVSVLPAATLTMTTSATMSATARRSHSKPPLDDTTSCRARPTSMKWIRCQPTLEARSFGTATGTRWVFTPPADATTTWRGMRTTERGSDTVRYKTPSTPRRPRIHIMWIDRRCLL